MIVAKIILGLLATWFGLLAFLRAIQHFNLMEGEDSYDTPFPFLHIAITIALIILIVAL